MVERFTTYVDVLNQALVVHVPMPWRSGLHLRSDRCPGRTAAYTWTLPPLPSAKHLATLEISGRTLDASMTGRVATVSWDGRGADGRFVLSPQRGRVVVTRAGRLWRGGSESTLDVTLGRPDARALGLGGFTFGGLHILHALGRTLFTGMGHVRRNVNVSQRDGGWAVDAASGERRFIFDESGRHLRTVNVRNGAATVEFEYDEQGKISNVRRARRTTTIERDGDTVQIIEHDGAPVRLTLDAEGNCVRVEGPASLAIEASADGLLMALTGPLGATRRYAYEAGRLTQVDDPIGGSLALARKTVAGGYEVVRLTVESREQRTRITRVGADQARSHRCCGNGRATDTTITPGLSVVQRADGLRIVHQRAPGLSLRTTEYPSGLVHRFVEVRDARGTRLLGDRAAYWTLHWEESGTVLVARSPEGRISRTRFDASGQVIELHAPGRPAQVIDRDDEGRPRRVRGLFAEFEIVRDEAGRAGRLVSADGFESTLEYDAAGRLTAQHFDAERAVRMEFDDAGNLVSFEPPGRPAVQWSHDWRGRRTRMTWPAVDGLAAVVEQEYDGDGLMTAWIRADGRRVEVERGLHGKVTRVATGEEWADFEYERDASRLARASTSDGLGLTFTWDGPLLAACAVESGSTTRVSYERLPSLLVARRAVGDQEPINFAYDRDGLFTCAGDLRIERDRATGRTTQRHAGATVERFTYDDYGNVATVEVVSKGERCWHMTYTHDRFGRITSMIEEFEGAVEKTAFAYDVFGRLVEVHRDGDLVHDLQYDLNGNIVDDGGSDGGWQAEYDDRDRAVTFGPWTCTHNLDGELTERSTTDHSLRLRRDLAGRVVSVSTPQGTAILQRDALGRVARIGDGESPATVLYDGRGLSPIALVSPDGRLEAEFIRVAPSGAPQLIVTAERTLRVITDQVGSPRLVIDVDTGEVVQRMRFAPLGRLRSDSAPGLHPFGFAGGLREPSSGMTVFGPRVYDPLLSQWAEPDPLLFAGGMTNLYGYADHDPVNRIDPTGTKVQLCHGLASEGFRNRPGMPHDAQHWWVKTDEREGSAGGKWGGSWAIVRDETGTNDDRPGRKCYDVENVKEDCVNEVLAGLGDSIGPYVTNTCQDFTKDTLDDCAADKNKPPIVNADDDFTDEYSPPIVRSDAEGNVHDDGLWGHLDQIAGKGEILGETLGEVLENPISDAIGDAAADAEDWIDDLWD